MTAEREARWLRHLEEGLTDPAERAALAEDLAADPAWRDHCLAEAALHARLRHEVRDAGSAEAFITATARACGYAGTTDRFTRQVGHRLRGDRRRRRAAPARTWMVPLLAAGLIVAVVLGIRFTRPSPTADGWTVAVGGSGWIVGDVLTEGTAIDLDGQEGLSLSLTDGTTVILVGARTRVPAVTDPDWNLRHGRFEATVASRVGRPPFQVRTPHARIEVVGTRFTVEVAATTTLAVTEGRVRFHEGGTWIEVGPGERTQAPAAMVTSPPDVTAVPTPLPPPFLHYDFAAGQGDRVRDLRGAHDLMIVDPAATAWKGDGLSLVRETHLLAEGDVAAFTAACIAADGFTIAVDLDLGIEPPFRTRADGPGRIVTLSEDARTRNVTLGWGEIGLTQPALTLRLRQDDHGTPNGDPTHWIPAPPAGRHRVVVTYGRGAPPRWFVDGTEIFGQVWSYEDRAPSRHAGTGSLRDWSPTARLSLGGEVIPFDQDGGLRPWLGTYHEVALWAESLSAEQARAWSRR